MSSISAKKKKHGRVWPFFEFFVSCKNHVLPLTSKPKARTRSASFLFLSVYSPSNMRSTYLPRQPLMLERKYLSPPYTVRYLSLDKFFSDVFLGFPPPPSPPRLVTFFTDRHEGGAAVQPGISVAPGSATTPNLPVFFFPSCWSEFSLLYCITRFPIHSTRLKQPIAKRPSEIFSFNSIPDIIFRS